MHKNLLKITFFFRLHSKVLESELQSAKTKMKNYRKSRRQQKKEIDSYRQQLTEMRSEATQKLFMTMRSHKINYDVIEKSTVIDPEFKQVRYFLNKICL